MTGGISRYGDPDPRRGKARSPQWTLCNPGAGCPTLLPADCYLWQAAVARAIVKHEDPLKPRWLLWDNLEEPRDAAGLRHESRLPIYPEAVWVVMDYLDLIVGPKRHRGSDIEVPPYIAFDWV